MVIEVLLRQFGTGVKNLVPEEDRAVRRWLVRNNNNNKNNK